MTTESHARHIRTRKWLCILWLINLITFTVALFLRDYFEHIGSWQAGPWGAIFATTCITKGILSFGIMMSVIAAHEGS